MVYKKVLNRTFVLVIILWLLLVQPLFAYVNQSTPNETGVVSKVINYIERFRKDEDAAVFIVQDSKINYFETIFDVERDYYGILFGDKVNPNSYIQANKPWIMTSNKELIEIRYEHNPSVYRSPVGVSSIANGQWYKAALTYNAEKQKFDISGDFLFTTPTSDKRGEWTIYLRTKDTTGKPLFDKIGIGKATFRVHQRPTALATATISGTTLTLDASASYDIDGSYKNLEGNYTTDKGIKKFTWDVMIDGQWIRLTTANATFQQNGKIAIVNLGTRKFNTYSVEVTDYDGATNTYPNVIPQKPSAVFETAIGNTSTNLVTNYMYSGNVGDEGFLVKIPAANAFPWNDEGAVATAQRGGTWYVNNGQTHNATGQDVTGTYFMNTVTTNFNNILKNNIRGTIWLGNTSTIRMQVYNRFGMMSPEAKKDMERVVVNGVHAPLSSDAIHTHGTIQEFLAGSNAIARLNFTLSNSAYYSNDELQIKAYIRFPRIDVNGNPTGAYTEVSGDMTKLSNTSYKFESKIPVECNNTFEYRMEIYSKRLQSLGLASIITTAPATGYYTGYIHTPLGIERYRNNSVIPTASRTPRVDGTTDPNHEISSDEKFVVTAETLEYAKEVTATFEFDIEDYNTGQVFSKGTPVPLNKLSATSTEKKWSRTLIIRSSAVEGQTSASEIITSAAFKATGFNNRDIESHTIQFKLLTYKLENFRITKIRDLQLEDFYASKGQGTNKEFAMNVNDMAIDSMTFSNYGKALPSGLAKGYIFEFAIDSRNFNLDGDTIVIRPSFYAITSSGYRDPNSKNAYWTDSNHGVYKVGEGSHAKYGTIVLTKDNRTNTSSLNATWRGTYYIPPTTFLSNATSASTALASAINSDIIVSFNIEGLKNGVPKFNYNNKQWPVERTTIKTPYAIGDVIRYGTKSSLDHLTVIRPR